MKTEYKISLGILGGALAGYWIGKSASTKTAHAGALLQEGPQEAQRDRSLTNVYETAPVGIDLIHWLSLADLISQTASTPDDPKRLGWTPSNVTELLRVSPTKEEALQIARDFNIQIDRRIFENPPYYQIEGQSELMSESGWNVWSPGTMYQSYTTISNLINLLRCAKFIQFNSDIPLIGNDNLYNFLLANRLCIRVFYTPNPSAGYGAWAYAADGCLNFAQLCFQGQNERELFRSNPSTVENGGNGGLDYAGLGYSLTLISHEAWHLVARGGRGIPHNANVACDRCYIDGSNRPNCFDTGLWGGSVKDYSLDYNGATAAGYWTAVWLADHTGSQLDDQQKFAFRQFAAMTLNGFCEQPPAFKSPVRKDIKLAKK